MSTFNTTSTYSKVFNFEKFPREVGIGEQPRRNLRAKWFSPKIMNVGDNISRKIENSCPAVGLGRQSKSKNGNLCKDSCHFVVFHHVHMVKNNNSNGKSWKITFSSSITGLFGGGIWSEVHRRRPEKCNIFWTDWLGRRTGEGEEGKGYRLGEENGRGGGGWQSPEEGRVGGQEK